MAYVILLVCVLAVVGLEILDTARRRARRSGVRQADTTPVEIIATPDDVERALTAKLLAGELDPELYRDCMAAIASTVDRDVTGGLPKD